MMENDFWKRAEPPRNENNIEYDFGYRNHTVGGSLLRWWKYGWEPDRFTVLTKNKLDQRMKAAKTLGLTVKFFELDED